MDQDEFDKLMAKLKADMERPTLFNKLYWRNARLERAYVSGDDKALRTLWHHFLAAMLMGIITLAFYPLVLLNGWWWTGPLMTIPIGFFAFQGVLVPRWRAMAYRSGWLAGRQAMYEALKEADLRGLEIPHVVAAEVIRDFNVRF